jgi:hypothetical protein
MGIFTDLLPSNERRDTQTHTATWYHKPTLFLAYFPYFGKNRVCLWDHSALCMCVYPPIVARQRLGKHPLIVVRQWIGKNPPIVARQPLGRNVTVVTNTHTTIEELLDVPFSMWPVLYQGKAISSSQNFLFQTKERRLKIKVDLCDLHAVCVSPPPINFRMAEPIFMKLSMYIMAPEPINSILHKPFPSVCVPICVSPYHC